MIDRFAPYLWEASNQFPVCDLSLHASDFLSFHLIDQKVIKDDTVLVVVDDFCHKNSYRTLPVSFVIQSKPYEYPQGDLDSHGFQVAAVARDMAPQATILAVNNTSSVEKGLKTFKDIYLNRYPGQRFVVNLSLVCPQGRGKKAIELLFDELAIEDVVFVCAAGNEGFEFPARFNKTFPNVIAVGGKYRDERFSRSVEEEGVNIVTNGYFLSHDGSSYAAPRVAGLMYQALRANPSVSPQKIAAFITDFAKDFSIPGPHQQQLKGWLDLEPQAPIWQVVPFMPSTMPLPLIP